MRYHKGSVRLAKLLAACKDKCAAAARASLAINCCDAALVALLGLRRLAVEPDDFFLACVPAPEALVAVDLVDDFLDLVVVVC